MPNNGLSEYEQKRLANIARNQQELARLNLEAEKNALRSSVARPQHRKPQTPRRIKSLAELQPSRSSGRTKGVVKVYNEDALFNNMDGSWERKRGPRRGGGRRGPRSGGDQAGAYTGDRHLPPQYAGHNSSCHICTQGIASWRGSFNLPLRCSKCPYLWCDRCLGHIYQQSFPEIVPDLSKIDDYVCLCCQGRCACQNPSLKKAANKASWRPAPLTNTSHLLNP